MTNTMLKAEGMTCASCTKTIKRVTRKLDWVTESIVNLATEKLTIKYNASKIKIVDVNKAVEAAGYKAVDEAIKNAIEELDYSVTRIENL